MNVLKLLLIEDDPNERRAIINAVARRKNEFTLTGETDDSARALQLCAANPPDVVILDLELHYGGGDGLSFLNGIKSLRLPKKPYILVTTDNISKITHSAVRNAGADYIITKNQRGYCADYVLNYIINTQSALNVLQKDSGFNGETTLNPDICAAQMQKVILAELNILGFKPGNEGYMYVCDAILAVMENPDARAVNIIADKNNKSKDSVSRAMQNKINRVWKNSDKDILYSRYTAHIDKNRGAPSAKEFIHYYAAKLKTEIL